MNSSLKISNFIRSAFSLLAAFALVSVASAQLRVGAARVEITPPVPADNQGPTGKYDNENLYMRAIIKVGCAEDTIANTLSDMVGKCAHQEP